MLNKIWFGLLCLGILYGFAKASYQTVTGHDPPPPARADSADDEPGDPAARDPALVQMGRQLTSAALDAATSAVEICLGLIGFMALWLGLLNIARDGGLVDAFARLMRPLMGWLFPGIPQGHPAQGAILMNLSANMLGLDNAATPMGLKAMTELQKLNPVKDTATNSMVMFLAINNSSVTIIPITVIGVRYLTGSMNPTEPLAGTLIVTAISTVSAVLLVRWFSRRPVHQVAPEAPQPDDHDEQGEEESNG